MTDTLSLSGKVAIVTGSGRENGIGAAIAKSLAKNGAAVTINHVSDSTASRAAVVADGIKAAGGKATVVQADIGGQQGAQKIVDETLKAFGTDHIDILVNNAGIVHFGPTTDMTEEQIRSLYEVNVYGPIFVTQATVPKMPTGGRIINISSVASKLGVGAAPLFSSTKAAVDSLTYAWAAEFGRSKGITVNSVAPGPVMTDILQLDDSDPTVQYLKSLTRAADRIGTIDDIADAVLLIASEKSRWITGQNISVSGGITS